MLQIGAVFFIKNKGKRFYKLEQLHYYKLGQVLLQIGQLLQIRVTVTTKQSSYYKLGQNVLQILAAITNEGNYYKLGQNKRKYNKLKVKLD